MKQELGLESTLQVGSNGVFEVAVSGRVVARRERFMFPSENEIVAAVRAARDGSQGV